jgi:hypothetical protein
MILIWIQHNMFSPFMAFNVLYFYLFIGNLRLAYLHNTLGPEEYFKVIKGLSCV